MNGIQKARLILGFFDTDPEAGAPAGDVLSRIEALFGSGERAYVERYRDPAVRLIHAEGRLLLAAMLNLAAYPLSVRLTRGKYGRLLCQDENVTFSLTYASRPFCLLCAGVGCPPVGADAETPDTDLSAAPSLRAFSTTESLRIREVLQDSGRQAAARELWRRWTIKEAVLKALGTGLSVSPELVDTGCNTAGPAAPRHPVGWQGHRFAWRSLEPEGRFLTMAVPVEAEALLAGVEIRVLPRLLI